MAKEPKPPKCKDCKKDMEKLAEVYEAYLPGELNNTDELKVFSRIYVCVKCQTATSLPED